MSNVLLIAPPWGQVYGSYRSLSRRINFSPPLGLCYVASALGAAGHTAKVIDAEAGGLDATSILREACSGNWDAVGISATTPLYPAAVDLALHLKEGFNGPIVLGGPHATILKGETLHPSGCFDYAVCGEGERTFVALLAAMEAGGNAPQVPGVARLENGVAAFTGEASREQDLDAFPFPDRSHLAPENYLWSVPGRGLVPTTSVTFSRGCPFACTFCSERVIHGLKVRWRSVDNMLAEINAIVDSTPYRHLVFLDDTLTFNREIVADLFRRMALRGYPVTFEGETRANLLDRELVALMREAGLVRMNIGIESGDPDMLRRLKGGISFDDVAASLRLLKSFGIETRGSVVIGAPYETRQTAERTLRYLAGLRDLDQPYVNIAAPYPGTVIREQALRGEGGARLLSDDYGSLLRYGHASMSVNDLTADDLVELQARGLRRAYMQPRRLLYNLFRAGLKAGLLNGLSFLRSTVVRGPQR